MSDLALFQLLTLFTTIIMPCSIVGFGKNLIKVPEEDHSQVVCTMALLRKYFQSGESLSGAVLSMSITSASLHIQQNLLRAFHTDMEIGTWSIVIKDARRDISKTYPSLILNEKPQCYFVIVENLEDDDLEDIFEDWKTNVNWNPLAQFVVYLASVEETDEEMTELMVEVLLNFLNKKIYNVNVIGQNEENGFYYGKTVFPYHPQNNCGNRVIAIETLDLCDYQDREKDQSDDDFDIEGSLEDVEDINMDDNTIDYNNEIDETFSQNDSETLENSTNVYASEQNGTKSSQLSKDLKNTTITGSPKFYLEELYRALFLDKFPKDLSGCPLIAAYRPWEPYIFIDSGVMSETDYEDYPTSYEGSAAEDDTEGNLPETRLTGIEFKMVETIGERLHITIDIQVENRNLYHLFQQLIDGDIEMVIGGIDEDPSISQFVSSTIPYHQDDLTWCVAKAKRQHNLFNFLASFEVSSWALTLTFILAATLNILLVQNILNVRLRHLDGFLTVVNRIYGILLSQSIHLKYTIPTTLKLSFGTAFFMALMFSNIYQSFLVSTLTTPQSSYQISHLEEIYHHRMTIMGSVENVRHLNKEGKIFKYIREQFQMCYNIEECLRQAATDEHVAVAVSRQHSFYNPRIPRDKLYCFNRDENLYVYLVTMLLPKKFHLLHKINPVIQHIIESGHMQKWARDLDMRRKIHEEIHRVREETFKSLTLSQVAGSFVFSATWLTCALLVFFLERWVYKMMTRRRTRWRIVRILHKILRQC